MTEIVTIGKMELSEMIMDIVNKALSEHYNTIPKSIANYKSLQDLAEMLNVNPVTISRAVKENQLKYHKIGKMYFFDTNDLFTPTTKIGIINKFKSITNKD